MNEEAMNQSLRRFLKKFGITAQREIEQAVRAAVATGRVGETTRLRATATVTIASIGLEETIEGEIELD